MTTDSTTRGRTARARGNAFEREVAHKLGGYRVGQYGSQIDVDVPGWMWVQCKNGASFPERIYRWLHAIPASNRLRALVMGDALGSGTRRRTLIIMDLNEFIDWYVSVDDPNKPRLIMKVQANEPY